MPSSQQLFLMQGRRPAGRIDGGAEHFHSFIYLIIGAGHGGNQPYDVRTAVAPTRLNQQTVLLADPDDLAVANALRFQVFEDFPRLTDEPETACDGLRQGAGRPPVRGKGGASYSYIRKEEVRSSSPKRPRLSRDLRSLLSSRDAKLLKGRQLAEVLRQQVVHRDPVPGASPLHFLANRRDGLVELGIGLSEAQLLLEEVLADARHLFLIAERDQG